MASNVFPMLSSSPPPIDDCPDDDDDEDEFGNFTSANIPYDSSFDSPVAVEKFKSFKSGDNGVNNTNFSEIRKFNFSNSASSPQEFVPDFSDESEHSKKGFKPIKGKLCDSNVSSIDNSTCNNKSEISSHKPVPPVPSEHLAHSFNDTEPYEIHKHMFNNSSNDNDHGKDISNDPSSESASSGQESLSVCDSSKYDKGSNHILHDNKSENICDQSKPCASDSYTTFEFLKCNKSTVKISSDGENCLPSDKIDVFEDSENDMEDFADFQHSEDIFPSNVVSSTFELDSKFPAAFDEDSSEAVLKSSFENKLGNELLDHEFDDFKACEEKMVSVKGVESSETVLKSSKQTNEFSDTEFDDFEGCENNMASAEPAENSEIGLRFTVENKQLNEFSDGEFDDFQGCGENIAFAQAVESSVKSDGDGYDDFQEFEFSDALKEDAEEDFADFQDFNAINNASSADSFADFSSVPLDNNKVSEPSQDSDFADFKEANYSSPVDSSSQSTTSTTQVSLEKSVDTLSTVINAIFPISDNPHDCDTSDETSPQILEQSNKSRRLWEKLHEVEQAPGLRFQWGVSHSFQQLLRSVNVDYHSILRTSSVPIFASGLSLLEPVKGLSSSANHESEDRNQIPKDPIPPVEFDWTGSGLVNPLDSGHSASSLMDLSFLSSVGNGTNETSHDNSFENELLKPTPALVCPESNSQTQILEQLLSKNVSSIPNSKLSRRPSDLSVEAVRVLDQLPDLSFMQAKVLMFPISSKT